MKKKDRNNVSCCNEGDCKPITPEQLTVLPNGAYSVRAYDQDFVFEFSRVFPSEDKTQYACIDEYAVGKFIARCLFIHFGT